MFSLKADYIIGMVLVAVAAIEFFGGLHSGLTEMAVNIFNQF